MDEEFEETIRLSDPDISPKELAMVEAVLCSPRLSQGPVVAAFENAFASWVGRQHAVAVSGSTLAVWLCLTAWELKEQDEVITSGHSWHQIARGIALAGMQTVFADVDYWSGTIPPAKALDKITDHTRVIMAGNNNGHPADWKGLRALADTHGLKLIEDCTESIGSRYAGKMVGNFGDCAIFDFTEPSAICCGEGAMILTDDVDLARTLRYLRDRKPEDRRSISISRLLPLGARMSEITAGLGLAQLKRIDEILARRQQVAEWYLDEIKSFEGIKPPYEAPDVEEVHWFLYTVHLGTRFSLSSTASIIEDLRTAGVEADLYSHPLYLERYYIDRGWRKRTCLVTEKLADRAIAMPFHAHLTADQIKFIVKTAKDASVNVGAGAAIYL